MRIFQGHGVDRGHALVDSFCVTAAQNADFPPQDWRRRSPVRASPSGPEVSRSGNIQKVSHRSSKNSPKRKQIHGIALLPPP